VRHTILIVEDDDDIRESLRDVFQDKGYHVRCASNGREGLDALRRFEPPSVVVLDLIMPVMSGGELYGEMKADPGLAEIPVIVSTSDPSQAPSGVLLLRKPLDVHAMLATVGRLCRP
jgi:CheY-like chemotaxis protein